MKAITEMNRSYVINTLNNKTGYDQNRTVQKMVDENRKEFEKKIDKNTLKEQFQKLNK